MIDETMNNAERVGFCQDCGRPLTRETVRTVGSGMFCEPCLEIRLAAVAGTTAQVPGSQAEPSAQGVPPAGAVPPPPQPPPGGFGSMPVGTMPPFGGDNPSPVLAGLLGFIPGVGAIYNGQFAKGIAHIVIFALLQSFSHVSEFFGLLAFLWCLYQAYEAYHTAKARREGRPLPDPLNLNHIGDHLGFTSGSRSNQNAAGGPANPYTGGPSSWTGYVPPAPPFTSPEPVMPPAPHAENWGSVPAPPPVASYSQTAPPPPWAMPAVNTDWSAAPPAYVPAAPVPTPNRFPATAAWLIGLGVLFLLLTLDSDRLSAARAIPFFLAAFAVWIFTRRMSATGGLMPMDGEGQGYMARVVCKLRAPVMLITVAVLLGLQGYHVLGFSRTWPVLVIVFGLLLVVERAVGSKSYTLPLTNTMPPAVSQPYDAGSDTQKGGL